MSLFFIGESITDKKILASVLDVFCKKYKGGFELCVLVIFSFGMAEIALFKLYLSIASKKVIDNHKY
ncbi:hypothetical protein A9G29_03815 [Gilliamella sp. Fer2-1]|nr:hypothetical protein A9G29_03815 [Gilliamella apicola]